MENVIYNELVARGYAVDVGVVEVDVKKDGKTTRKQLEIDFVVNTGFNKIYIQSAYALRDQVKRDQETLSLRKSGDFFKKIVVTAANVPAFEGDDGITYIGVIPFLLDQAFLEGAVSSASRETGAFPTFSGRVLKWSHIPRGEAEPLLPRVAAAKEMMLVGRLDSLREVDMSSSCRLRAF